MDLCFKEIIKIKVCNTLSTLCLDHCKVLSRWWLFLWYSWSLLGAFHSLLHRHNARRIALLLSVIQPKCLQPTVSLLRCARYSGSHDHCPSSHTCSRTVIACVTSIVSLELFLMQREGKTTGFRTLSRVRVVSHKRELNIFPLGELSSCR